MCECSLTQTTVDPGQRCCSSCADAAPVDAVLPAGGAAGRCHGNNEPDCVGAGEGAGAGAGAAGAKPAWGALVVDASCALQAFWNCGQVAPPVVPAAFAACHCAPHCFMTLWLPPVVAG